MTNVYADVAQLVEHFTRNEGVVGSSPIFSFMYAAGLTDLWFFLKRCLRFFYMILTDILFDLMFYALYTFVEAHCDNT